MNAFEAAGLVEDEGLVRLLPFVERHADRGHYVLTDKGRLSKFLQETVGDLLFNKDGSVYSVEIKCERTYTGNLFLETWSNRNLDDAESHSERGSNVGWLTKLRSDLLFYYFIDKDTLLILSTLAVKRWAFGWNDTPGRLYSYKEVRQRAYFQKNDTLGRLVPIGRLEVELTPPPRVVCLASLRFADRTRSLWE